MIGQFGGTPEPGKPGKPDKSTEHDSLNDLWEVLDKIDLDLVAGLKQVSFDIGVHLQGLKADLSSIVLGQAPATPGEPEVRPETSAPDVRFRPQPTPPLPPSSSKKSEETKSGLAHPAVKELLRLVLPNELRRLFDMGSLLTHIIPAVSTAVPPAATIAANNVVPEPIAPNLSDIRRQTLDSIFGKAGPTKEPQASPTSITSLSDIRRQTLDGIFGKTSSPNTGTAGAAAPEGVVGAAAGAVPNAIPVETAGGAAGLAGMLAPIAVGAIAAKVAADMIASSLNDTRLGVKDFGDSLTFIARKDVVGLFTHGLDMAGQQLGKIPIVGGVLEAEFGLLSQTIKTSQQVFNAFTKDLLDAQRHLAEVSPSMAGVFAVYDMRQTLRDIQIGERTAGSAGNLAESYSQLQDHTIEMQVLFSNLTNGVGTMLSDVIDRLIVTPVNDLLGTVNGISKWLADVFPALKRYLGSNDGATETVGDWLKHVDDEGRRARARNRPEFQRPNFGHLRP